MTIELPVLRLGLAGFPADQQESLAALLPQVAPGAVVWETGKLTEADAWLVCGERAKLLADDTLRIAAAVPTERALQLHLPDIDRPIAFSLPLASPDLGPVHTFDMGAPRTLRAVLRAFESSMSALTAQFCLATHLVEHQTALGRGIYEVMLDGRLLAVVSLHGDIGVLPGAGPADFEQAEWRRRASDLIPEDLARTSVSQLMWQYSQRTQRDLLPRHYRTGMLYFRRPPRLPHRMLRDTHLVLMRELGAGPASFESLQASTGMHALQLARDLASLYFVGAITSNPKRAAVTALRAPEGAQDPQSGLPSGIDSVLPRDTQARRPPADPTVPAPMGPH